MYKYAIRENIRTTELRKYTRQTKGRGKEEHTSTANNVVVANIMSVSIAIIGFICCLNLSSGVLRRITQVEKQKDRRKSVRANGKPVWTTGYMELRQQK